MPRLQLIIEIMRTEIREYDIPQEVLDRNVGSGMELTEFAEEHVWNVGMRPVLVQPRRSTERIVTASIQPSDEGE
jgi:hypothetical protein